VNEERVVRSPACQRPLARFAPGDRAHV